jgi:hypothetical protein
VGVRETTKLREMLRQSPFPNLFSPSKNRRCSSSVHGIPFRRSCSDALLPPFGGLCYSHSETGQRS